MAALDGFKVTGVEQSGLWFCGVVVSSGGGFLVGVANFEVPWEGCSASGGVVGGAEVPC